MNIDKINISAEILFNARKKFERIKKLPENCIPQSINEGYLIQEKLIDKYLSLKKDAKIIGKKVGCTNITAQKQLNVNEPIYGSLFSHFSSQSNCTLNANDFVVRMILRQGRVCLNFQKASRLAKKFHPIESLCPYSLVLV